MFFINGVIPQKTTPRNNLWQNVLYVKKMSVTIVPAPLLGIFESLSSGMILRNTDALCIAHTHVIHCHQISFQCLLAIFTCCFTIFFHTGALIMSKFLAVHCFCIILLIKEWTKNLLVSLYLQAEGKWCSKDLDVHPPFYL